MNNKERLQRAIERGDINAAITGFRLLDESRSKAPRTAADAYGHMAGQPLSPSKKILKRLRKHSL